MPTRRPAREASRLPTRVVVPTVVAVALTMIGVPSALASGGAAGLWQSLTSAQRAGTSPSLSPTATPDIKALTAPTPSPSAPSTPSPTTSPAAPPKYPFTSASVWRSSVLGAPVDPNSAAMVADLNSTVKDRYGGIAAFNAWDYNNSYYVADASTPRVNVLFNDCQHKGYLPDGLTGPGGQFTQVPVPVGAVAAKGTDAGYSVYSPATDQLWEMWQFTKNSAGQWTACWGGRLDHVSTAVGYFSGGFGASASGLAVTGGMITLDDARTLNIQHALDLAIPDPAGWPVWRWPAQRTDGGSKNPAAVPEGARLRLDPSVDVSSLHLTPLAAAIARAAQTYGFVVTDFAGAVSVVGESGLPEQSRTGVNPWTTILGSTPNYLVMRNFPWDHLQVVAADYGRR